MKTDFYNTEKDIIAWLEQYKVKRYTLVPDNEYGFVVNVEGDVDLSSQNLKEIKVKFNLVLGYFLCADNQLTSLEFCPVEVGENFNCSYNHLTSLKFCPITIGDLFNCSHNQLSSLGFCTTTINGCFNCSYNQLTSLEFGPSVVGGDFDCSNNQLFSLNFCPAHIHWNFFCANNQLQTLEFCPEVVRFHFDISNNPLLGDIQNINDFQEIYQFHRKIVNIKAEQLQLSQDIGQAFQDNEKVNFKL